MEVLGKESIPSATYCEWCLGIGTSRCGRCHSAYYCCREHQISHWSIHKKVCKKQPPLSAERSEGAVPNETSTNLNIFSPYDGWCQNNLSREKSDTISTIMAPTDMYNSTNYVADEQKSLDFPIPNDDEIFTSLSSELLSSDNNFWDIINTYDAQNIPDYSSYLEMPNTIQTYEGTSAYANPNNGAQFTIDTDMDMMQCASLNDICANVVHDLNTYGICVLDRFIGINFGSLIFEEVRNLYMKGIFKKGELVNPNPYMAKESIRSDVTTWVDGTEEGCRHIGSLIKKLDVVVTTCNKMPNNGLLSQYKLHRRTKAMIACYPGDGTYYKKHVDNPHKDGRCITCIYYLNQNWDIKQHGGLLRMFPSAHNSQVANIEPIFDRMIFFWSDKRNPHEVLPSFATRFAITVWYFDADERDKALMMYRQRALKSRSQQHFMK